MRNGNDKNELISALDGVKKICTNQQDKGAGFILLAAQKDKAAVTALSQDILDSFGSNGLANTLVTYLTTVHNLSQHNKEHKDFACEFARNIVREKAIEDYATAGSMDKSFCRIL